MTNAEAIYTVRQTASVRSHGVFVPRDAVAAWREIVDICDTLAWLARVVFATPPRLSDTLTDAEAATQCSTLLQMVRAEGRRDLARPHILELADVAVKALGGTVDTGAK